MEIKEITINELEDYAKQVEKIIKIINSKEFYRYLERQMTQELLKICEEENVTSIQRGNDYMNENDSEIEDNEITLFNDSKIDIQNADTFFSESAKENYPALLSLSKLIEYGTGIEGANSGVDTFGEWEYDLNNHREEGWDWNNQSFSEFPNHTTGQEGKAIYYKLQQNVEKNVEKWVNDYIKSELK